MSVLEIAENVRRTLGLTAREMAARVCIDESEYSKWRAGKLWARDIPLSVFASLVRLAAQEGLASEYYRLMDVLVEK